MTDIDEQQSHDKVDIRYRLQPKCGGAHNLENMFAVFVLSFFLQYFFSPRKHIDLHDFSRVMSGFPLVFSETVAECQHDFLDVNRFNYMMSSTVWHVMEKWRKD